MLAFEKVVDKISRGAAQASMWSIFGIMFVLMTDIILRFVTENLALLGTYEMTELAMVIIVFMGLSVTQLDKDHIRVVMLIERFPWRLRTFIEAVIFAFTTYLCFMLFYAGILQTQNVLRTKLTTQVLFIPHWPFMIIMTVGLGVLTATLALDSIKYFIMAIKNEKPENPMEKSEVQKVLEETEQAMESQTLL